MSLKSWLQEKLSWTSRWDWLTCEERMLKLMTGGEWISTDTLHEHFRDYRDSKYQLKKRGYIFERKYEGKNTAGKQKKWTQYKTFYRLAGRVPCVPASKWKRGYIDDFTTEEIISVLWKRDILFTQIINDNPYHFINYDSHNKPTHCLRNNSCCE